MQHVYLNLGFTRTVLYKTCDMKISGKRLLPNGKLTYLLSCQRTKTTDSAEYQYLQQSTVPTMHFQKSLPRLPIPELRKTCDRYLASVRPLVDDNMFQNTEKIVEDFHKNVGKELNNELVAMDKSNKHTSYISKPWSDMYLKSRDSLVLNFNPCMIMKNDPKPEYNTQILRATNLLISSLRFVKSLRTNILEPEVYHLNPAKSDNNLFRTVTKFIPPAFSWYGAFLFKAFPLDMSQYEFIMNSTRIPKKGKDEIKLDNSARHMLVIKNGNFYVFDVFDQNGNILPPDHILALMQYVDKQNHPIPEHQIGYFTAQNRDVWTNERAHLENTGNHEQLKIIDSAAFALVLDDLIVKEDIHSILPNHLYGPAYNRWFDKSIQLIVTKDGYAGLNFEHSWGDGVAVLRYFNEIFKDSTTNPRIHPNSKPAETNVENLVKKLDFKFDDKTKSALVQAKEYYLKHTSSLVFDTTMNPKITRDLMKKEKISPDSVIQLAFQIAYKLEHGRLPATYEASSTAAFKHGRTETVRPVTIASKKFVDEILKQNPPSPTELRQLMNASSQVHGQLTKEAAMGQGFDRHLFALKHLAETKGITMPVLFNDPVYHLATHFHISSSTLYGPSFLGGAFGPVVPDGLGVAYSFTEPTHVGVLVTAYKEHNNPSRYIAALNQAIDLLHNMFEKCKLNL